MARERPSRSPDAPGPDPARRREARRRLEPAAPTGSPAPGAADLLWLQGTAGNQAVRRLVADGLAGDVGSITPARPVAPARGAPTVQALWDLATFKDRTKTTRLVFLPAGPGGPMAPPVVVENARKAIVAIDTALNAVPALTVDNADQRTAALKTLLAAIDKYVSDKTLGAETGWFGIRGLSDKGNERIPPVLELKSQVLAELRGGRYVIDGVNWDLHDRTVEKTDDLANLKTLVAQRFGLDPAKIGAVKVNDTFLGEKVTAATDWTVKQLKQAYRVLTKLPLSHTVANQNFAEFLHASSAGGGGSFSEASGVVKIGATDRTRGKKTAANTSTGLPDKNYMDWTVRHEIGHAVAAKTGAVDDHGYCTTPAGGEWIYYGKNRDLDAAREVFASSNSHVLHWLGTAELTPFVNMIYASAGQQLLAADSSSDVDGLIDFIVSKFADLGEAQRTQRRAQIAGDPGWEVIRNDLEAVWKGGTRRSAGPRSFVKSADYGIASFANAAWNRKVSAYQFRSPHEWFAEAYAAYYDPTELPPGSALVKQGDAATRDHIRDNVHDA